MRVELTGRHVEITPALRRIVDTKLSKLERLLNDGAVSAQAVLTREKYRCRTEITLHARGEKFLHGVGAHNQWSPSVGQAVEKLAQQAQRVKGKWQGRKRGGHRTPGALEPVAAAVRPANRDGRPRMPRMLKTSRQPLKAMSVSQAVKEAEAGSDGVVVFRDAETSALSVLYRRKNGELVLVETEG